MQFLNGFKTILGAAGMVVTIAAPHFAPTFAEATPHAIGVAQGVFGLLGVLGLIHKVEKAASPPPSE